MLSERKATATRKMGTLECLPELPVCTRGEPWPQKYPGSRKLSEARMQAPGRGRQQAPGGGRPPSQASPCWQAHMRGPDMQGCSSRGGMLANESPSHVQ